MGRWHLSIRYLGFAECEIIGFLPYDPDTVEAEFRGLAPADTDSNLRRQIEELYNTIRATYERPAPTSRVHPKTYPSQGEQGDG